MLKVYSKTATNCIIFHQYGNYSLSGGMYIQYIPFCIPRTAMHHMGNFQDENSFENTPLNHNIKTTVFPWSKLNLINLSYQTEIFLYAINPCLHKPMLLDYMDQIDRFNFLSVTRIKWNLTYILSHLCKRDLVRGRVLHQCEKDYKGFGRKVQRLK